MSLTKNGWSLVQWFIVLTVLGLMLSVAAWVMVLVFLGPDVAANIFWWRRR